MNRWYVHRGKRIWEMGLALVGLVLFAIPMAAIAWGVYRNLGKPILFRQKRLGLNGQAFTLFKFRTMTPDGSIPPFGRWLRRTAMDELPQLINILRGEMGFVGPRPLVPEELADLKIHPNGHRRMEVRPGLTGLAQICGPKVPNLADRLRWDLAYIDRCSFGLDLKILIRSVWITMCAAWEGKS
jgi:lipopolysaccharide/colanic/teichoic acid biosynthesis glycosyltransferase